MAGLARRVLAEGSIYLSGTVASSAATFVALVVYARVLGAQEYGQYALIVAVSSVLAGVIALGGEVVLARFYFDARSPTDKRNFSVTWITFVGCWSILVVLAAIGVLAAIHTGLGFQSAIFPLLVLAVAIMVPYQLGRLFAELLRVTFRPVPYAFVVAVPGILGATFGVVGVAVFDLGLAGAVGGLAVTAFLGPAMAAALTRDSWRGRFEARRLRPALRFGLPLVPATLAFWVFTALDRIVIERQMSVSEVGAYALAAQLVTPLGLLSQAISQAWMPRVFHAHEESAEEATAATYSAVELALAGYGLVAVVVSFCAPWLVVVIGGPEYAPGAAAMPTLVTGQAFMGASVFASTASILAKRTALSPVITVVAAVVCIGLLLVLVPTYGLPGAGGAVMAAYLTILVGALAYSLAVKPGRWRPGAGASAVGALVAQAVVATAFPASWASLVASSAAGAVLGAFVWTARPRPAAA